MHAYPTTGEKDANARSRWRHTPESLQGALMATGEMRPCNYGEPADAPCRIGQWDSANYKGMVCMVEFKQE